MGFDSAGYVRVGKYLLVNIDEADKTKAESAVTEMCQKLLANPVIEDFQFSLEEISTSNATP